MAQLTEQGLIIQRLDQIINTLEQGFRQIYGQNINLDPDTPDGQMIGILAQIKMDFEELAENVYKQLDPDHATGAWLEQRVAYAGLIRKGASYSYLRSAIITGEPYSTVYAGLTVSDGNKVRWVLTHNVQLNDVGSGRGDFRSENLGAFNLEAKQKLNIETITLGIDSVTSNEPAEQGKEEETDAQLRQRFYLSRSQNSQNGVEAIFGAIQKLPDVKQLVVLENTNAETDKNGVSGHSINVIVDGGEATQIAEAIYLNKSAGCGVQGEIAVTLEKDYGERVMKFDRATPVDIEVAMQLVRFEDFTDVDKTQIKAELTTLNFGIGKSVSLSRLYSPINKVGGFWVKSLTIARKGQHKRAENVEISPRELARILESDITIEVE